MSYCDHLIKSDQWILLGYQMDHLLELTDKFFWVSQIAHDSDNFPSN